MDMPNVIHPKKIKIKEITSQVISYDPLTDNQALKVALSFYQQKKWTKADQKKVITVMTSFDHNSAKLLSAFSDWAQKQTDNSALIV